MTANNLLDNAYIPYSSDAAAAVVRSKSGNYFPGSRIENISYPISISAVQSSLFCCLSEGEYPKEIWASNDNPPHQSFWEQELGVSFNSWDTDKLKDIELSNLILDEGIDLKKTLIDLLDSAKVQESDFPVSAIVKSEVG